MRSDLFGDELDVAADLTEAKGDAEGHPFHGNRFTGGIGGGGDKPTVRVVSTGFVVPGAARPVNLPKNTRAALITKLLADAGPQAITSEDYMQLAGKYLMAEQDMNAMTPEQYRAGGEARSNDFSRLEETMGDYETADAWLMNMELRGGTSPAELSMSNHSVAEMDECFKVFGGSFDEDKVVFRGAIMPDIPLKGEVYHDKAFVSTINTPSDAIDASSKSYAAVVSEQASPVSGHSTVWEITIPKGSECLAVRPDEYKSPANDSFQEIVLPRDANLVVEGTKNVEGVTFIKASYLGSTPLAEVVVPASNTRKAAAAPTVPSGHAWRVLWLPGDLKVVESGQKGDATEHAFHGNRYTGGIGGGLETNAIKHFGLTDIIHEAGYVTPSGKLLDFSGRHYSGGYHREGDRNVPDKGQRDYFEGQRNVDHREVPSGEVTLEGGNEAMRELQEGGFVRVQPTSGELAIEITKPMTDEQVRAIVSGFADMQAHMESVGQPGVGFSVSVARNVGSGFTSEEGTPDPYDSIHDKYIPNASRGAVAKMIREANAVAAGEAKGDVSGHPFHGNRFTGGIGGGEKISLGRAKIPALGEDLAVAVNQSVNVFDQIAADEIHAETQRNRNMYIYPREQLKDEVAFNIAKRTGLTYERATAMVKTWARSSSDTTPDSVALQIAAGQRFGIAAGAYIEGQAKFMAGGYSERMTAGPPPPRTDVDEQGRLLMGQDDIEGHTDPAFNEKWSAEMKSFTDAVGLSMQLDAETKFTIPAVYAAGKIVTNAYGDFEARPFPGFGTHYYTPSEGFRQRILPNGDIEFTRDNSVKGATLAHIEEYGAMPAEPDSVPHSWDERMSDASKVVGAIYDHTQETLAGMGVKELTVFRGMNWYYPNVIPADLADPNDNQYASPRVKLGQYPVEIDLNPLSSFSVNTKDALEFGAGDRGIVLGVTVPVNRVFSLASTGLGCLHEGEVVVIGGPTETFGGPGYPIARASETTPDEPIGDQVQRLDSSFGQSEYHGT